ncbi:hypothetical protein [Devosia sp.]|uniref:ribonuclease toxin HepT-like protein n=1 Tax=Devosia sp. TaxID=1871048 RepID=UPI00343F3A2B
MRAGWMWRPTWLRLCGVSPRPWPREAGGFDGDELDRHRAEMALMHAMQSGHAAAEAALLRILRILDEERPERGRLARQSCRPAVGASQRAVPAPGPVVRRDCRRSARDAKLSSSRHAQLWRFRPRRIGPSLEAAKRLATSFPAAVSRFKAIIDPER